MARKHIVVLGTGFAGFTAALELKALLGTSHDVTVISKRDEFVFSPSLVSIPFGLCSKEEVLFSVRAPLERVGVRFLADSISNVNFEQRTVSTKSGLERYDYLVVATGAEPNFRAVPGLGPRGYTQSTESLSDAIHAGEALEKLVTNPGPLVIGAVVGAPRIDAAYELLINAVGWLRKRHLLGLCPITFITPETEIFQSSRSAFVAREAKKVFQDVAIEVITALSIRQVNPTDLILSDGRLVPFSIAFLVPSFLGVEAMRASTKLTDTRGFVRVNEFLQSPAYPEVFAAGAAVACDEHDKAPFVVEASAQHVAKNIAALVSGTPLHTAESRSAHRAAEATGPVDEIDSQGAWIGSRLTCHHYLLEQTQTSSVPPPR